MFTVVAAAAAMPDSVMLLARYDVCRRRRLRLLRRCR